MGICADSHDWRDEKTARRRWLHPALLGRRQSAESCSEASGTRNSGHRPQGTRNLHLLDRRGGRRVAVAASVAIVAGLEGRLSLVAFLCCKRIAVHVLRQLTLSVAFGSGEPL